MNRILKNVFFTLIFLFGIGILVGCKVKEDPKIILGVGSDIEINYEEVKSLDVYLDVEEKIVIKYTSSNKEIVTVDQEGNVKGVDIGDATIKITLEGYPNVKAEVKVKVKANELSINGDTEVFAGEEIKLIAVDEKGGSDVIWDSEDNSIATVTQDGTVTGKSVGTVNIIIVSSITGEVKMLEINVIKPDVESIDVTKRGSGRILLLDEVKLNYTVLPKAANQEVTWKSSNEKIATVDQFGNVETHASGEVEIVATSVDNPNVEGKITLVVEVDPIELIKRFNVENPVFTKAKSYLIPTMNDYIYGSVNLFMAADMNLKVNIIPIDKELVNEDGSKEANPYEGLIASREIIEATDLRSIRPGVLKPEIKYITYHDTGNYNVGTGAQNHATYMVGEWNRKVQYLYDGNGNLLRKYGYRSWHYTVDDTEIIQHLPDEEIAFHGDTYEAYTLSIGIETAISQGSNFFTTWHRTAKLIATLLDKHDISIENIEQHHDWSGKDCPQVLRATGLWQTALDMVKAEYLVLTELAGYNIEFISNAPENVTNDGRIVKLETAPKMVSYLVKITNDKGYNETAVLYSTLPAKTI